MCQEGGGYVIVLYVILSAILSFREQDTNAETDVDQTWQAWAMDDPLELINFWW